MSKETDIEDKISNHEEPLSQEGLMEEITELKKQLNHQTNENQILIEKYNQALKTAAHMQNLYNDLKDKSAKDMDRSQKKLKNDFFHQIIKIIDMFEVALNQMNQSSNDNITSVINGVNMVYNYMINSVETNFQLKKINCKIGDEFDYNIHEAQQQIKIEDGKLNNTIAKIISCGYEFNGEIIRNPIVDVYIS